MVLVKGKFPNIALAEYQTTVFVIVEYFQPSLTIWVEIKALSKHGK
jgi:hypothetical protein